MTPYFRTFLGPRTLRECPTCNFSRPLYEFRRWTSAPGIAGRKRMLHDECNACGAKHLEEMTSRQREAALATDDVSIRGLRPLVVERMNERDFLSRRAKQATAARRHHAQSRRIAWSDGLFTRLRDEVNWAMRARTSQRARTHAEWLEFVDAYLRVLRQFNRLALVRYRRRNHTASSKPTMEDVDPATYIDPQTITRLASLYSRCGQALKNRKAREPWFLEWRKESIK